MYIPQAHRLRPDSLYAPERTLPTGRELLDRLLGGHSISAGPDATAWSSVSLFQLITWITAPFGIDTPSTRDTGSRKRATTEETDTTIGIVVGVVLGVFLVATIAFLYVYRNSIRLGGRRRRRHRKSGSKSSKSSKSSDGGGGAPAAPAAPPPAG